MIYSPAQRCLDVLELLADAPAGLALSAVATRLKLPKSATHRFLAILAGRGFVRQDAATGHYALTLKLPALGFRFLSGHAMPQLAQPALDGLAARTGELARLAMVEDDTLTWVALAQGASSGLRYDADAGTRGDPARDRHRQGLARDARRGARDRAVEREGRIGTPGFGPRAVTTLAALKRELRATRKRGWGEALEEGEPGVAAIAVALRPRGDATAPACATCRIAGPLARMDASRRAAIARETLAAAREIEDLWPARSAVLERGAALTP